MVRHPVNKFTRLSNSKVMAIVLGLAIVLGCVAYFMTANQRSHAAMLNSANKSKQTVLSLSKMDAGYSVSLFIARHPRQALQEIIAHPPKYSGNCSTSEVYCLTTWSSLEKMDIRSYPSNFLGDKTSQYNDYIRQVEGDPFTRCSMQYFISKQYYDERKEFKDGHFTSTDNGEQLCVSPSTGLTVYTMTSF